jgi:hypothetical protein
MLIILPALVWFITFLLWLSQSDQKSGTATAVQSAGSASALAFICLGAYLALTTELLSLINAVTSAGVALIWGAALFLLSFFGFRKGWIQRGYKRLGASLRSLRRGDYFLGGVLALLCGALFVIVAISSSGNNDSMQYHLPRVMHWAQNASLRHYATGFAPQLCNPIWAEEAILHLRLLWGNDQFADLVQWIAMLGSLIAVAGISSELGIGRRGKWIAIAFAFSIPMGVLQSVSTQNDYVAGFWLLCAALLSIRMFTRPPGRLDALMLGLAVGLGMLTKGTFYPYVVPFGLLTLFLVLRYARRQTERKQAYRNAAGLLGIMALAICVLNAGYWIRNLLTFGGPLGSSAWVSGMTAGSFSLGTFFSSLVAQIAMNFSTPFDEINEPIIQFIRGNLGPIDPRLNNFSLVWRWNQEDMAGNPLHVLLIAVAIIFLLVTWKRVKDWRLWAFLASTLAAFAIFVLVVHLDGYGVRYQLPEFLLFAPLVGAAIDLPFTKDATVTTGFQGLVRRVVGWIWDSSKFLFALFLLLAAIPLIMFNHSRPLLALKDGGEPYSIPCQPYLGCTLGSIFLEPPTTSLFTNNMVVRDAYLQVAEDLRSTGCQQIGLRIDSHDPEYLFWWLLGAPQSGVRLESIYTSRGLEQFIDPTFKPCAIICTICGNRTQLHGLDLVGDYSSVKLFAGDGFVADEGPDE